MQFVVIFDDQYIEVEKKRTFIGGFCSRQNALTFN